MNHFILNRSAVAALGLTLWLATGCSDRSDSPDPLPVAPVTITSFGANAVSVWDEVAANAINLPPAATGTDAERQPIYYVDMATLHVALYDAAIAIAGTHRPYAITPTTPAAGASMDAAVNAAAYGVLKGLFPARSSVYQGTYDSRLAAIVDGDAKTRGIALGTEVALGILALRANDGRATPLADYVPGTAPGKFRGTNPVNRSSPFIKPLALMSTAQFRAVGPPALESVAYATDFNETKSLGAAVNSPRSAAQTEMARFHTEAPPRFWTRNLRQFATSQPNLADNARLMASLWVAKADALLGCFESKYQFEFWRPSSAIVFADTDANPATAADATWTPVVPTPNHPEYPAAHACTAGAVSEVLRTFFRTSKIIFDLDSSVADTFVHSFASTDEFADELQVARIYGGMHFRTSTVHGRTLGENVGKWVTAGYFLPRN